MPCPGLHHPICIMTFKEMESKSQRGWVACPELQTSNRQTHILMSALFFKACALNYYLSTLPLEPLLTQLLGSLSSSHTHLSQECSGLVTCFPGMQHRVWDMEEIQ